jgi:hypothetical protein
LQAAGHAVRVLPVGVDFAQWMEDALSGPDQVIVLLSREHRASESDWARVPLTGVLAIFQLDSAPVPATLRAATCKSLHDLDEEEALEVLMATVGGPQNPFLRTG